MSEDKFSAAERQYLEACFREGFQTRDHNLFVALRRERVAPGMTQKLIVAHRKVWKAIRERDAVWKELEGVGVVGEAAQLLWKEVDAKAQAEPRKRPKTTRKGHHA